MSRALLTLVYRCPMERQMLLGDRYHLAGGPPSFQVIGIGPIAHPSGPAVVVTLEAIG